mgnify:CR=1 FL=1
MLTWEPNAWGDPVCKVGLFTLHIRPPSKNEVQWVVELNGVTVTSGSSLTLFDAQEDVRRALTGILVGALADLTETYQIALERSDRADQR